MEEVLLSIIIGAIEGATSWLVRESLSNPGITADTPVTWGYVVAGKCQYQYVSTGGAVSDRSGTFSMSSNTNTSQTLINCPDFTYYTIATGGTGIGIPTITNYWSSGFKYDGNDYYSIEFSGDNSQNHDIIVLTSSQNVPIYFENSFSPQWSGAVRNSGINFSNCPDVQNIEPAEIYLPSTYNQEISFNDFRQLLIDWGNDVLESESINETIPADSVPDWNQLTSETESETESEAETEAIEPDYQPFSIDYNEILSEDELESILNRESYQLDSQYHYSGEFIAETIPEEIETINPDIADAITTTINIGSDIVSDMGLMPIYAPLAIFSIICYIIRGCR